MSIIENIINFFKKPYEETMGKSPDGICSACWGYQEYDKKLREIIKDEQIDVNNHQHMYTLIQNFMVKHIDGIKLKESPEADCPTCGTNKNV
jgi:hypothetical protein